MYSCIIFFILIQFPIQLHATIGDYKQIRQRSKQTQIVFDDNVIGCIVAIGHDALQTNVYDNLPESIKRCYSHMSKGLPGLPIDDVITALPNILQYAVEQYKKKSLYSSNFIANFSTCDSDKYDLDHNFFITQKPTKDPNTHSINQPIIKPGVYCLTEDITGTLIIQSSHVTVKFKGHTLNATHSGGIISSGNSNICIEEGIIAGSRNSNVAIVISNGDNIKITNMNLIDNNLGIILNGIKNFVINNSQFSNCNTNIQIKNSNNGKITSCQLQNNNSIQCITSLTIIYTDNYCSEYL